MDSSIQEQGYSYFLPEAQDLLQAIEQDLLGLKEDRTPAKVHNLMRSAHTLKGAAASVGVESIKTMAHSLEDVFKSLYNPDVIVDSELEGLLLEAYEYLRMPVTAAIAGSQFNDAEVLKQADSVFKRLKTKLGKNFDPGASIPTSAELGFDITRSIFESGVNSRLNELESLLTGGNVGAIAKLLQTHAEVFLGLAESLNLSGFGAIAKTTIQALNSHPDQVLMISQTALTDFRQGQAAVFAGDRTCGGEPSLALRQLAQKKPALAQPVQKTLHKNSPKHLIRQYPRVQKLLKIWKHLISLLNQPIKTPAFSLQSQSSPIAKSEAIASSYPQGTTQPTNSAFVAVEHLPNQDDFFDFNALSDPSVPNTSSLQPLANLPPLSEYGLDAGLLDSLDGLGELSALDSLAVEIESPVASPVPAEVMAPIAIAPEKVIKKAQLSPQVLSKKGPSSAISVRVNLEHLESLSHSVGELLINQNRQALQDERLQRQVQELVDGLNQHKQTLTRLRDWSDQMLVISQGRGGWQDRGRFDQQIETSLFDPLEMDRHSELHVFLYAALEELVQLGGTTEAIDWATRQFRQSLGKQGQLLNHVRDDLMEARMIPLGAVLNRFPRVLQQLVEVHNKRVNLQIRGAQVMVDKAIAEKLYDPLLHLVRNAFDHGLESAKVRQQQGKPEIGQITINAYQQGNRTIIEVKDDGQGLNLQKICRRGFEMKQLPSPHLNQCSTNELLELMFQPGFSTAEEVTDLSGRGVGLDVVRSQLRSLDGNVAVQTELHQGTTFTLQLPLTLMTARLLVCQVGCAIYAFLSDEVERIIIPQADQIESMTGQSVFHWKRGQDEYPVPICRLADLVNYSTSLPEQIKNEISLNALHLPVATDASSLLLLRWKKGFLGISVDQILGEQELVIRPVSNAIAPPNYIYGCSILADGQLTLVVDGAALVHHSNRQGTVSQQSTPQHSAFQQSATAQDNFVFPAPLAIEPPLILEPKPTIAAKRVLVIDDSATVRQTLALTLKKAGYQVIQAQDGLDAIAQLQQHSSIQLITCDLEMPKLNGFEFLMRYKKEFSATVPVTMLTSRSSEKHRQLALQLGASAYLTKPYTEHELISTLVSLSPKV
ncbi:MAG: response regulator [Timaviella obliquedivisa GSE-PSE-MK23-08B]|jgi:chemotaxis protein histidine kinase CheA|nr:response regulator [Timaviella obliquedivisa GSE-PSE-MK23-08B]